MSTAAHTETNGQAERTKRVIEDVLRIFATSYRPERQPPSQVTNDDDAQESASADETAGSDPAARCQACAGLPNALGIPASVRASKGSVLTRSTTRATTDASRDLADWIRRMRINPRQCRAVGRQATPATHPPCMRISPPRPDPQPRDAEAALEFVRLRKSK
ncbi:hypothetical protein PC119_g9308 [Phytophthora cactorum]|uniref:Integrase catalytic domain-containing protein n=1 Tax=Phytophthora cactorum TaxID=29920 RepID=A0A8T1EEN2_9STRA|nr:hypothetical protein PC114_g9885 [Phytophthora cactorum]KAG2951764.1 hypothetical protein PC117_g3357 [Phytophthora cactorum]KAG3022305.1 hypothetical protein PC119_g9308 [Phytophthora cactorum]KAG3172570.1 hypothetical protein C6341_g10212 [Phytophthora cactorum]